MERKMITKPKNEHSNRIEVENFEADFPLFFKWAQRNNIFQTSLLIDFLNNNNVPASAISVYGDEMEEVCFAVKKYFRELDPAILFAEFPDKEKKFAIATIQKKL